MTVPRDSKLENKAAWIMKSAARDKPATVNIETKFISLIICDNYISNL
jgi:hypothetical protein